VSYNASWHRKHPLLPHARLEARTRWFFEHRKHCRCQPPLRFVKSRKNQLSHES
jgi:hypothetical protein